MSIQEGVSQILIVANARINRFGHALCGNLHPLANNEIGDRIAHYKEEKKVV